MQSAFREVFLNAVKDRPEIVAAILEAARREQLVLGDRRRGGGVGRVIPQGERGAGKDGLLVAVQGHGLHAVLLLADQVEAVEHVECAVDDVLHDVALVGHADIPDVFACDHAVLAHKSQYSGEHLVTAGAIVRVQQHDFVGFVAGDRVGVAKPEHVFCVFALALVAHAGLADHERLETFVTQAAQHVDGGNVV